MGLDEACSICLEVVTDNGYRSWAKLLCGHQFHLDCIGSAFNVKGQMQCPNCRKIEKGQWLYASGCRPLHEFNMDDWAHDEDLYDLNYSEMSFGVHWCPFSGLTRLHSSFDEGDFSSHAYHDLVGHHTVFADHTALSSGAHPCPYVAYVGIHPSSSNSTGSVATDGPNFNNHWNTPNEMAPSSYVLPYHHGWEQQHSSSFPTTSTRVANSDQRTNSDIPRPGSFVLPVLVSHGSVAGAGGPVASSMVPTYPGSVARTRDRVQALQAYFQQQSNSPSARIPVVPPGSRRSSSQRGLAQVGPLSPLSDQAGGFYFYPSGSSGRTFQEAENPASNRFHAWERDHLHVFLPDRDPIWAPFHGGSNSSIRSSSLHQRHMPSQNRS